MHSAVVMLADLPVPLVYNHLRDVQEARQLIGGFSRLGLVKSWRIERDGELVVDGDGCAYAYLPENPEHDTLVRRGLAAQGQA